MNKCSYCHLYQPKTYKYRGSVRKDGTFLYKYKCRDCNTAHQRKKYRSINGQKSIRKAIYKYNSNNPEKYRAWTLAQTIATQPCLVCGSLSVHRHHHNYNKPLEVIFLCPLHHRAIHTL